jgi:uncharacterized membrane protein
MNVVPQTNKSKRISLVALSGAVMALIWALAEWAGIEVPAPVISTVTSLVMLLAGFIDFTHADDDLYDGSNGNDG